MRLTLPPRAAPRRWGALPLLLVLLVCAGPAFGQGFRVQGVVLSAIDDSPLPGVNVVEVGTQTGAITNADGTFALTVSGPDASLVFSFIGFVTQTVEVDGQQNLVVTLAEDIGRLDEVVVTAFGIEREAKALGYSVSEIGGEQLTEAREANVAHALAGRVAGVTVSKPATGVGASSRVVIRGATSLGAGENNQPLYVVDGIPIDNTNPGSAGMWGGQDLGDGISSINPDDIEDMSILKGAAAAALYGSRAKNGVILITTKKGRAGAGLGVEFNSNVSFEDALVGYTDFQDQYGSGTRGEAPANLEQALDYGMSSWGAPLNGANVIQFDGVERPYSPIGDKLGSFYNTGLLATNTLALTGGTDATTFRFSATRLDQNSIVPNSGLSRTNFTLRGTSDLGSRLSADAKITYVREDVDQRSRLSDSPGNPNWTVAMLPPNIDPAMLEGNPDAPGRDPETDLEYRMSSGVFTTNPYFAAYQFINDDTKDRFIGFASLRYDLADWLSVQGRAGRDWYNTRRSFSEPWGLAYKPNGFIAENEWTQYEDNFDLLFLLNRDLTPRLNVSGTFGGNRMYRQYENIGISGDQFIIPGLSTVANTRSQGTGYSFNEKQINSILGSAEVSWNDLAFVTVTGRNDWSSTLPEDNRSYFYPSVSGSFVFSDALTVPEWITFGKVRASWAQVGGDTDPYQLALTYSIFGQGHLGNPLGTISQGTIPLADLKPQKQVGREVGFDVRFFENRMGLDFTYYQNSTTNQILSTTISPTSGYGSRIINAGEMKNAGIELLWSTTPAQTGTLRWDLDVNFALNNNEVVELYEEQETLFLGESRTRNAYVVAQKGEPYGTILGYRQRTDAQGRPVFDDAGLPVRGTDLEVLGNASPDWSGGLINTLRWKNWTVGALVDVQWGGELYSATNAYAYNNGLHQETLVGREEGIVGDGVVLSTCTAGDEGVLTGCAANTTRADAQDYYSRIAFNISEEFVYDASFVKLRELKVSYRLPASLLSGTPIQLATISLVGRNLALLYSDVPNLDPESTYNATNGGLGLELAGVPQTRSFGFNFNIRL